MRPFDLNGTVFVIFVVSTETLRSSSLLCCSCKTVISATSLAPPRSETSGNDLPYINGHNLPIAAGVQHRPPGRRLRLAHVARTHTPEQRQISLVFVAIRCLPRRRDVRIDIEQKRDVRLRQILLHICQPRGVESLRFPVGDAGGEIAVTDEHGPTTELELDL